MARPPVESDQRILSVFLELEDPPFSTREIEKQLEIEYQGTYDRLKELEEKGLVKSRKYGTALGWSITEEGLDLVRELEED